MDCYHNHFRNSQVNNHPLFDIFEILYANDIYVPTGPFFVDADQ